MPAGRPSSYTQEIADRICAELAEGKSLRRVCDADDMPAVRSIFNWLRTNEEFLQQYERAKQEAADYYADEIIEIADDGTNDYMERENSDGSTYQVVNSEHIQRSRLRVDARKWVASKLKPKKYGDKTTHSGDPDNPIHMVNKIERLVLNGDTSDTDS